MIVDGRLAIAMRTGTPGSCTSSRRPEPREKVGAAKHVWSPAEGSFDDDPPDVDFRLGLYRNRMAQPVVLYFDGFRTERLAE